MTFLSTLENQKLNNFNLIRCIAAISVVFGHSFPISLGTTPLFLNLFNTNYFGHVAVLSFFVISGFLITKSYCRNPEVYHFIESRILRIVPAFILSFIYCIIIGFFVTSSQIQDYIFSSLSFLTKGVAYLGLRVQPELTGVFSQNPMPNAINGSLWTLPVELRMYVMVLLFGLLSLFKKKHLLNSLLALTCIALLSVYYVDAHFLDRGLSFVLRIPLAVFLPYPLAFILGMYAYLYKEYVPINPFILIGLIAAYCLLPQIPYLETVLISYATLFFAFYPKTIITLFTKAPDYSYGIYIFSFPTQQTLVSVFQINDPYVLFCTALPLTILASAVSWHLVEKPALSLKGKTRAYFKRLVPIAVS